MSNSCSDFVDETDSARAVQIVSPVDHSFQLESEQLERILLKSEIRDRHVVVISTAGAYRKGKSFLMNFLLKYLNARVSVAFVCDLSIFFKCNCSLNSTKSSIHLIGLGRVTTSTDRMDSNREVEVSRRRAAFGCGRKYSPSIMRMATKLRLFCWTRKASSINRAASKNAPRFLR